MKKTFLCFISIIGLIFLGGNLTLAQTLYPIEWTDLANVTVNANKTLTRSIATGYGWVAGAASINTLLPGQNGHVEFPYAAGADYLIGLSKSNPDAYYGTIEYSISIAANGEIRILESASHVPPGTFGWAAPGDVFKIVRGTTTITYYRNATIMRTVNLPG